VSPSVGGTYSVEPYLQTRAPTQDKILQRVQPLLCNRRIKQPVLCNPFLGNRSVNTFPRQPMRMQQWSYCWKVWPCHSSGGTCSSRLPTAAAWVPARVKSCGICGRQSGTEDRFPLPVLIPLTAPHSSSSIIRGWYNRPVCGRRTNCTQSHPTPRK
jgi:hypothetical protein